MDPKVTQRLAQMGILPVSKAFSIGTVGCNFQCTHCQNFDISQYPHEHGGEIVGQDRTPEQMKPL